MMVRLCARCEERRPVNQFADVDGVWVCDVCRRRETNHAAGNGLTPPSETPAETPPDTAPDRTLDERYDIGEHLF